MRGGRLESYSRCVDTLWSRYGTGYGVLGFLAPSFMLEYFEGSWE